MHLGREPKGIVSSGVTTREPAPGPHWDTSKLGEDAWYAEFVPELLLDPRQQPPLDPRVSQSALVREYNWTPQASGIAIPDDVAEAMLAEWFAFTDGVVATLGEADEELSALEGEARARMVRHRSRERALRSAKLASTRAANGGRLACEVPGCGFDFEQQYGDLGAGFAEVHHLNMLAESGVVRTSLSDLAVVCSNCHRMIHSRTPMLGLESVIPYRGSGE